MSDGLDDLRQILEAVAIESPARYRLHGIPRDVAPATPHALILQLQAEMYGTLFCRSGIGVRGDALGCELTIGSGDRDPRERQIRLYWHVDHDGIAELIRLFTETLDASHVPFRAGTGTPGGVARADAAVTCFDKRHYGRVRPLLQGIHSRLRHRLSEPVPRFTKRLGAGLGLAEDPDDGGDFGRQRCAVVADALWHAYIADRHDHARLPVICRAFEDAGIVPTRLHLQPGSRDDYAPLAELIPSVAIPRTRTPRRSVRSRT